MNKYKAHWWEQDAHGNPMEHTSEIEAVNENDAKTRIYTTTSMEAFDITLEKVSRPTRRKRTKKN